MTGELGTIWTCWSCSLKYFLMSAKICQRKTKETEGGGWSQRVSKTKQHGLFCCRQRNITLLWACYYWNLMLEELSGQLKNAKKRWWEWNEITTFFSNLEDMLFILNKWKAYLSRVHGSLKQLSVSVSVWDNWKQKQHQPVNSNISDSFFEKALLSIYCNLW